MILRKLCKCCNEKLNFIEKTTYPFGVCYQCYKSGRYKEKKT
jgi:hypothetical protein